MDELETRLRQALTSPSAQPATEAMLSRVHRGVRRRRQRHAAGAASMLALVLVAGAVLLRPVTSTEVDPQPAKDEVVRSSVGRGPCCVAVAADGVWVMNQRDRTLQRVDPRTNEVGEPVPVEAEVMRPVGEKLLVTETHLGNLWLFDPRTERTTPIRGFANRGSMAYDGRTLWLGSFTNGELARVDPQSGKLLAKTTIPGVPSYDYMAVTDEGELWVTTWDGELLHLDVDRRRILSRTKPFPDNIDYVALAAVGDSLFAVSGGTPALVRIDQSTGRVESRRELTLSPAAGAFPHLVEQPEGTLWLALGPDRVDQLDPTTGETTQTYRIPLPEGADPATYFFGGLATGYGSLWTGLWPDDVAEVGTIVRLDLQQE